MVASDRMAAAPAPATSLPAISRACSRTAAAKASTSGLFGRCSGYTAFTLNGNERISGRTQAIADEVERRQRIDDGHAQPWRTKAQTDTADGVSTMERGATPSAAKASSICKR